MEPALKFTGFMLSSKKIIAGITFPVCPDRRAAKRRATWMPLSVPGTD
jgi:hypothetical protein